MTTIHILFYLISAVTLSSALMVVTLRNPVHSALFLVLTFVSSAALWILLHAEFLALILVLVYVGAVMTLFLFVVMMLSMHGIMRREAFVRYLPFYIIIVLLVMGLLIFAIAPDRFGFNALQMPTSALGDESNTANLGGVLYTQYAYPFEVAGMLLLTAIIAAITLAHRVPSNRKKQNISQQIATKRDRCVRLVQMPATKKPSSKDSGDNT